ncbi:PC4 and SFRS1-interacting protein [Homalodisca vitripennis]|nr:PC4 and SFRS1-interacting protein [Homalodisca vitripennis]
MSHSKGKNGQTDKFYIGDLIFAKVKGHRHWPGKITDIDSKTYKHVTKYEVKFFATEEIGSLIKNDICHYYQNKQRFPLAAVKKNKELYETALNQIAKEWERVKSSTPSPSRIRTTVKLKTPSNKNNNPSIGKCSTPLTPISPNQNDSDYPKNNENVLLTCTKDVGVNTPEHLDLNYQLSSLTEKCISLEKSLMDEKSLNTELNESKNGNLKIEKPNTEDFQTLILKQELNKYKTENKNLTLAIELLQNEYKNLEAELNAKNMYNQKCSHCFPPTQIKSQENSWKTVIRSSPYPSNTESKPKLIILGDSHGKNLSLRIEKHTEFNVSAFIRPGANLDQVIEEVRDLSRDLGKNDRLLVIGGTNSVQSTEVMKITDAVHGLVRNTKHTNLILASLPMRHDMPELDIKIARINSELERITEDSEFVDLLPLHLLPRHLYTNHGLHFNNRGKTRIVHLIANLLDREKKTNKIRKEPLNNVPINTDISSTINIVEADMFDTFDQWKMDRTAAFAHTISADFSHHRHMSGGVAVLFRRKFGKPIDSEYVDKNLTCQKIENGAVVYSLVTKSNYYGKPTVQDYDSAFSQLAEDFKKQRLKTLICSPMGCVRDFIQPDHFIQRLTEFQRSTQATIYVVSYNQSSSRVLRNGLSHPEFLKTLRSAVNVYNVSSPMNPIHKPSTPLTQEISTQPQVHPSDSTCNTVSPESPESLTPSTALTLTTNLIAASSPNSPSGSYCSFTPHQTLDLNSPLIAQRSPI